MSVPDFQTLMLPVLVQIGGSQINTAAEVREAMAAQFRLSQAEREELLPNGRQPRFANRVGWAISYLKQARLIEAPRRGQYTLTERGREVLASHPSRIDIQYLERYEEFRAFRSPNVIDLNAISFNPTETDAIGVSLEMELTPDEQMRSGYRRLRETLGSELLARVKEGTPRAFEELVVDLLVRMGYGGSREDAASVVGGSGDEGIDGIIKEDRLGLDAVYVQAKRWQNTVGRPDIQRFAGALQGQRARKGVFITTSGFSAEARAYASNLQTTIVLVDGVQLAQLMLDYGVGVTEAETLKVLRLDDDYFTQD